MNTLTDEIDDLYLRFLSVPYHNISYFSETTKKSRPVLKRYITIKEQLSPALYPLLNNRKKMTLTLAELLCKNLCNHEHQEFAYAEAITYPTKERKAIILNHQMCGICCDTTSSHEVMSCCGQWICSECFFQTLVKTTTNLTFQALQCAFCRQEISLPTLKNFTGSHLQNRYDHLNRLRTYPISLDPWRNSREWINKTSKHYRYNQTYMVNIYMLYEQYLKGYLEYSEEDRSTHHIGKCNACIERYYRTYDRFDQDINMKRYNRIPFDRFHMGSVAKDCANDEALKAEMFICQECRDREDNCVIKRCPHCGIKSIRPDGCNFVQCECRNYWCFVCNKRLPGNHEGHNVHYWIGNGSGPYDDHCRVSTNYEGENFVIDNCGCRYCRVRNGAPACTTIDCPHPAKRISENKYQLVCEHCEN